MAAQHSVDVFTPSTPQKRRIFSPTKKATLLEFATAAGCMQAFDTSTTPINNNPNKTATPISRHHR